MKKVYRPLTKDQKARGVVFSSTLSRETIEQPGDLVHEVLKDDPQKDALIPNYLDDSFFDDERCQFRYNIIRK